MGPPAAPVLKGLPSLPPFPKLELQDSDLALLLPNGNALRMRPEELNALMLDDGPEGYFYKKPEIPFEQKDTNVNFSGYFYDRPSNPMTIPTRSPSTTTAATTTTSETSNNGDLPEDAARIL